MFLWRPLNGVKWDEVFTIKKKKKMFTQATHCILPHWNDVMFHERSDALAVDMLVSAVLFGAAKN